MQLQETMSQSYMQTQVIDAKMQPGPRTQSQS